MAEIMAGAPQAGAADVAGQQTSGQAATAQAQAPQQQAAAPDAQGQQEETFESLIAGKYKQQYDSAVGAAVQKAVKQRLKGQGAMKAQIDAMAPLVDQLGVLYGIDTSDPRKIDYAALAQKFGADNRLYEAEAMERGSSADAVRSEYKSRAETAGMRRQLQEYQIQEAFAGIRESFDRDVAARYGASFDEEMGNETFARLIASHVPPKTAYEVVHMEEIQQAQAQAAANMARNNVMQTIQAQGARPTEIGGNANGGQFTNQDPRSWTKQQREDIIRRVQRGERIVL